MRPVPIADGELTSGANGQLLTSTSPKAQRPLANLEHTPPRYPQGRLAWILPSSRKSGIPWDPSHHPSVISYLEGPHFSYDRTSDNPLIGASIPYQDDIYQRIKHIK